MRLKTTLLSLAAALALAAAAPTFAQEVSDADREAISAQIASFDGTMRAGDMAALLGFVPPKVRAYIAEQAGIPESALEPALREQVATAMQGVTIDDFGMDLGAATFQATPDGSRTYGLIPTTTTMTVEGTGTMRATAETLAIEDGGEWYLMRVDDANQIAILNAVYPEFAGVTFEPSVIEPVQ